MPGFPSIDPGWGKRRHREHGAQRRRQAAPHMRMLRSALARSCRGPWRPWREIGATLVSRHCARRRIPASPLNSGMLPATDGPSRPKATCVCQDGSNSSDQAGVIERVTADSSGGPGRDHQLFGPRARLEHRCAAHAHTAPPTGSAWQRRTFPTPSPSWGTSHSSRPWPIGSSRNSSTSSSSAS